MKTEIIKPDKKKVEKKSLLTPIIYLIIGGILAFKNDQATNLLFYIIGIFVIVYGLKALVDYYRKKDMVQYKNITLSVAISAIILGILLIILRNALSLSIRYVIGFFLVFMGISRFLTQFSLGDYKNFGTLSNLILVILGLYSIFVSNVVLVIIGWILIANGVWLIWEYLKH